MDKADAIAALGAQSLLAPVDDLCLALAANQLAGPAESAWLPDLPAGALRDDGGLLLPGLPRRLAGLVEALAVMARPLEDDPPGEAVHLLQRARSWQTELAGWQAAGDHLSAAALTRLTHGQRPLGDSLRLLVMDLHEAINRPAARLATEVVGGHVWALRGDQDHARVAAFMRGVERTAPLKLDRPGLATAATRDGDRLLIQNDIGTNGAHGLVLRIEGLTLRLTYSDLHRQRFDFFRALVDELGARHGRLSWSAPTQQRHDQLDEGKAHTAGSLQFDADDEAAVRAMLEGIGSRIEFLIDWNRARKRLLPFVDKAGAVAVLAEHAALRQTIAQVLRDGLAHGGVHDADGCRAAVRQRAGAGARARQRPLAGPGPRAAGAQLRTRGRMTMTPHDPLPDRLDPELLGWPAAAAGAFGGAGVDARHARHGARHRAVRGHAAWPAAADRQAPAGLGCLPAAARRLRRDRDGRAPEALAADLDTVQRQCGQPEPGLGEAMGTAVTVQRLVFGNDGGASGTGVGFTRHPGTAEPEPWIDVLFNAQGEDVVSGRRRAHPAGRRPDRAGHGRQRPDQRRRSPPPDSRTGCRRVGGRPPLTAC